uniref:C2H2-type domain-containing protein n=1 Tax=Panagrolaimus sp. ES5 TaxID=591445 RepID=A0AC34GVQ7_9BILA
MNGNSKFAMNHKNSILTDGNRKRLLESREKSLPSTDKRTKLSTNLKKDMHGSGHYFVSEPNNRFVYQDGDEFAGQFRCTSLNCNKVLSNNVSFMYHLWAHVGFFQKRDYSAENEEMTDEKFTRICTICLRMFETACEKTKHYLEVHRGVATVNGFCHMCEIVDYDGVHASNIKHRQNELPYECKRCKFRSSSRMALIDHFSKAHIGTTLLICPFCPYTTQITASERLKPIVLAKNYVNHVTEHGELIAKKCSCCSYKFIDDEQFKKHTKCHQNEQHKWNVQTKHFKTLKDTALVTKPRHEMLSLLKCLECKTIYSKSDEHLGKLRKCSNCSYETTCIKSYWKHKYLSDCNPENKERLELAVTKEDGESAKPKCSLKIRKNLKVMRSPGFIQNFRLFRDFSFDRKPSKLPPPTKSKNDLLKERREKLRQMTTARKTNDIPSQVLDEIATSVFGEKESNADTYNFAKQIRAPSLPFFEEFLKMKKQKIDEKEEEESERAETC